MEAIYYIIRSLIEEALEWGIPIWVLDGDIAKAYDNTPHDKAYQALIKAGTVAGKFKPGRGDRRPRVNLRPKRASGTTYFVLLTTYFVPSFSGLEITEY